MVTRDTCMFLSLLSLLFVVKINVPTCYFSPLLSVQLNIESFRCCHLFGSSFFNEGACVR